MRLTKERSEKLFKRIERKLAGERVYRHPGTPHTFYVLREDKDGTLIGYRYWIKVERKKFSPAYLLSHEKLLKGGWSEFEDTDLLHLECETLCEEEEQEKREIKRLGALRRKDDDRE